MLLFYPVMKPERFRIQKTCCKPLVCSRSFLYAMRFATMTRRPLVWEYSQVDRQMSLSP